MIQVTVVNREWVPSGDGEQDALVVTVVVVTESIVVRLPKERCLRRAPFLVTILLFSLILQLAWNVSLCQGLGK